VAEVAHAKNPEGKARCSREFQGVFAGDGPGDESSGKDGVEELAGDCKICGFRIALA